MNFHAPARLFAFTVPIAARLAIPHNPAMPLPVVTNLPLPAIVETLLAGKVELLPWSVAEQGSPDVAGIYTYGHMHLDGAMLDRLPGVKVISNYGVGVDHIDVPAARRRGIKVGNTPRVLDGAVADMTFALLLASARGIVEGDRYARGPQFLKVDHSRSLGWEVHGMTLGIVGMGNIGVEVARRAQGFDMTVLYHNRTRRPVEVERRVGARFVGLDEILRQSDYLVLNVPLNDSTRGLIGAKELSVMKPTATLINIARGPVVDTGALTVALQNRTIRAAGLDVTDPEPLPREHPLLSMQNVTITPHLGSATVQTRQKMAEISVENLLRGLRGEALLHEVG